MNDLDRTKPAIDRTAGATLGFFVGLGATPLLGPILGPLVGNMSAPLFEEASFALRNALETRRVRVETAYDVGCDVANKSREELAVLAIQDDRRIDLLTAALEAAATSDDERKIRVLGRSMALGIIATDEAKVDEHLRVVKTLAALDSVDVRVLEIMRADTSTWQKRGGSEGAPAVADVAPAVEPIIDAIFARLSMHGLITDESAGEGLIWGGSPWRMTVFGRLCTDVLLALGQDESRKTHRPHTPDTA